MLDRAWQIGTKKVTGKIMKVPQGRERGLHGRGKNF